MKAATESIVGVCNRGLGPKSSRSRGRAVMLVTNPCVNDSRVIRAAETVAAEGFEVIVLATAAPGVPETEKTNGVLYRRLTPPEAAVRPIPPARPPKLVLAQGPVPPQSAPAATSSVSATPAAPVTVAVRPSAIGESGRKAAEITLSRRIYRAVKWRVRAKIRPAYLLARAGAAFARRTRKAGIALARKSRRNMQGQGAHWMRAARRNFSTAAGTARAELLFRKPLEELRPDIIHAHDFVTLPVAAKASRRFGAICIYDSHELEMHRNIKRGELDRKLCGWLERRYIRAVDAVITVCDSIADHLARAYRIPRPEVVMNAPDSGSLMPVGRDVRSDLGLDPDTPLAIYVGRITIGRGIEQLAHALEHLPGMHLALLGAINAPTVEAATRIAHENGTEARFHVLPPVPPSAVLPYVATADVSVVPIQNVCLSYYYCLPNKLIESTVAGLPVVVSDFPEMRRYVELGRCGLTMDAEDPADIARAVDEAYRRRAELRLDPARRATIEAEYGWEAQRVKLIGLYERLWQKRQGPVTTAAE